jgi:predicted dehydrogenase
MTLDKDQTVLRIGILGSDNSHADRFSEILNRPEHPSYQADAGARVVAIWGAEPDRTRQVAETNHIAEIIDSPAAMLGKVDAILCVTRHGGLHRSLVEPYLSAGAPTFVDKPLAVDPVDAAAMVTLAKAHRTPFCSFSTVRFSADVTQFLKRVPELGAIRSAIYTGPASRRNPYGGIIFYAIHCIELMLMTQGTGVQWVQAVEGPGVDAEGNGTVVAVCAWADGATAILNLLVNAKNSFEMTALGSAGAHHAMLDISDCYRAGMQQILAFLRGGKNPVAFEEMVEAIHIGAAIERSLNSGQRIQLKT